MLDKSAPRGSFPFFGAGLENQSLKAELSDIFSTVISSGQLLNGPDVFSFESAIAQQTGRAFAVAVNSATDALFFALIAHGIGPGDDVLVPAYSFVASASSILRTGATPVFVDVHDASHSAPCTINLENAAKHITKATKAIVWVGLFGGVAPPQPIIEFAAAHDLLLIEDASQSYGASVAGHKAGTLGHASIFSFDRNKLIGAIGTGGAVLTDDPAIDASVRKLRYHGVGKAGFETLGYNSQMPSVTAAILSAKLKYHDAWTKRRQQIAQHYDEALSKTPATVLRWNKTAHHVRHKYVMLAPQRDALETHLKQMGIPTRRHYQKILPDEPVFRHLNHPNDSFAVSRHLADRSLSLPIYAQLSDCDVERVTDAIRDFFA